MRIPRTGGPESYTVAGGGRPGLQHRPGWSDTGSMPHDRRGSSRPPRRPDARVQRSLVAPGKRTLTSRLPVQRAPQPAPAHGEPAARGELAGPGHGSPVPPLGDVHAAAAHGTGGAGGTLPHIDQIQRSFGRHDMSRVVAHTDDKAAVGAEAMGADAFATGDHVAFRGQPDLHTAAHEAAHIVQQRGGVQLQGGVGEAGDAYERHADQVADLVVQGKSSEALLSQVAAPGSASNSDAVQRRVFVGGKQVHKDDATGAPEEWIDDDTVRSYRSRDEMTRHAAGATDYLGNLPDGTWVRFDPHGLNVLGENHSVVKLDTVMVAVGSKSFIYERFSDEDMAEGSALKSAYDAENADKFAKLGVAADPDKKKFGAEPLLPKLGQAMNMALPYFLGDKPLAELTRESRNHVGNPVQRYLKLAWAHTRDARATLDQKLAAGQVVPPRLAELAQIHAAVAGSLDSFITSLPVDGWIGDALARPGREELLPLLAQFAIAFTDAMIEVAIADPSSGLDAAAKEKFGTRQATSTEKNKMFMGWRDTQFEESVARAAQSGVRYAGMGATHLRHLAAGRLPPAARPYYMDGPDLTRFQKETARLAKVASKGRGMERT